MKLSIDNVTEHQAQSKPAATGEELVRRFVGLPLAKQKLFLQKLAEQGRDFAKLPIPERLCGDSDIPLSVAQQGLWILAQLDPASTAYHIAGGVRLVGDLDREALTQAFHALALRHDALRTLFYAVDGQPRQWIPSSCEVALAFHDLSELAAQAAPAQAGQLAEAEARVPFDLERGPLWRVLLVRLPDRDGQSCHELNLTLHHLIADGWSLNRLLAEFGELYGALQAGREPQLPALPIRHADFAAWQRHWLAAGEAERQLAYWTDWLGGEPPVIELPYDRPRPAEPSQRGGRVPFVLPEAVSQAVLTGAHRHGVTPFQVLLAAFNVLLYRYSGQTDLRIGLPLANRQRPETQALIGYFVNTVVLRTEISAPTRFDRLLQQTQQTLLQAQAHPDLPFEHLVDALQPERRLGQNPLFQILINHQPTDVGLLQAQGTWQIEALDRDHGAAQFDLSLDTWQDRQGRIGGFFTYAADLFDAGTIERLAGHFQSLLAQLLERPQAPIASHRLLSQAETERFAAWNTWEKSYDAGMPVQELIRHRAAAQPEAVALIGGETRLTYAELEMQANRLAHRLIGLGVERESRVALLLPRGVETIVAMLAVLKAGGAYLPLDPEQPEQRLAELIAEAGVSVILAERCDALSDASNEGLHYRSAHPTWLHLASLDLSAEPATPPAVAIHPEQLAYLILTSGSTGQPKGVAVPHGALARHCLAIGERYAMQPDDMALHFAAFTFDAAMEQWLVPLINGCRLLVREEMWSADQAYDALVRHGVTWFEMPPAYLIEIARWAEPRGLRLPLRACSVGGEAVPKEGLAQIRGLVGDAPILNGYGPTETLITPLVWTALPDSVCDTAYAPIGTGVGERALYILDKDLNPLPPGVVGELYIGGPCLARGYLGRPDLTAERFLPDPFSADGGRLYRTGDRVRLRADGNVDYFGRNDHQIKLRGFRIELGEIEARALAHPGAAEAVAVADGEGSAKRLLLYAVGATDAESLKNHLRQCLPDYMVPAHVQILEQLPRLTSGKLNRHALPKPDCLAGSAYRAPQTRAERDLAAIWQAVLGVERVGADDNFFELGGDSIMAIRLVSRARQAGWSLTPKDLFLHQTVAKLAANVQAMPAQAMIDRPIEVAGDAPLTAIQAQFFAQAMRNRSHWNLSLLLHPNFALDAARLAGAAGRLIEHHDGLRLRYRPEQGAWRQFYADAGAAPAFEQLNADNSAAVTALANRIQRSLDLQHGPLFKAVLINVADGSQRLLLAAHHLLVDGVSWRILLEDLQALYDGAEALPGKTASLQQWGQCLRDYAASEGLKRQLPYWQGVLQDAAEPPRDFAQSSGRFGDARTLTLEIDAERTHRLLTQAPSAYRTQINDLLLAALARALTVWSGDDVAVDLESHGREHGFDGIDLSRSVGWFTSVYPVRLAAAADIGATIKVVKQSLREVPDAGLGFGVLQYLAGDGKRAALNALPQARIGFNYFGRLDAEAGNFALAPETAGDDHDPDAPLPYWLEINAQVAGGVLQLRWRYSASQYRDETVRALLDRYRDELLNIVAHCLSGAAGATPSDFPLAGLTQAQLDALPLPIAEVEDIYPLSPMQQGMLFHDLLAPETGVYVNQMSLDIDGLDSERFAAAWRRAIDRHSLLRSAFLWRGESEQPLQAVYKQAPLRLEMIDWRGREIDEADLRSLRDQDRARGFEHARAPLMRMILVRLSERRWHWIWTSHHMLLDGWSTSQLLGEVLDDYVGNARTAGAASYRDYIAWLSRRDPVAGETFWRGRLSRLDEPTLLANALARPTAGQGHGSRVDRLDAAATARLQAFAQQQRVTLNTVLQAAWAMLLGRYCGRDTVAMGATVSGRPADLHGVENIVGLFINTLPLIAPIKPEQAVGDWLRDLQQENLALRDYEHTPLYDVQRWAGQAGAALFDSLLVFENFPVDAALKNSDSGLRFGLPRHVDTTHYPLTLNISIGESLGLAYGYWLDRFDGEAVAGIARHFQRLLFALADDAGRRLGELLLPTAQELTHQSCWSATATVYPPGFVHTLIGRTALAQPEAPALLCGEAVLSYAELEHRSNRLAWYLIETGVGPDVPVGIAMERSFELVVGLLAIVKAGGAYVPLDPDYPAERLAYMIDDSGIGLLLSHGAVLDKFTALAPCAVCNLDTLDLSGLPARAPEVALHPAHPAYLIYTSGSTGRPKGASNTHEALANRLHWMQQAYAIGPADTVLQKTPFSFDVSVWEFFWPLMTGARLAIAPPGAHRDPVALAETLQRQQVSTVHFVPSMLAEFVNQPALPAFPALQRIVCSGEALPADLQQRVFDRLPGVELDNLYGPTEAAIDVTHWTCRPDDSPSVPIGEPIANIQIHILDKDLNPQPAGVAGELYLGGIGLARGYHRRPGLTAERFLPDPFGRGGRLYRTGDLARRRADGVIDYLGRIDHQIKLRGLRIELGEIETALLSQPGIREAAVLLKDAAGGPRLVAYLAASEHAENDADLQQALHRQLPDYMVPSALIRLDGLPKTANGKLDRKALPEPYWQGRAFRAPQTATEQTLAALWQELLGVGPVGLDDNFFELGGHSLLAMKLAGRIARHFQVELGVRRVFEAATLAALAAEIDVLSPDSPALDLQSELADALAELQGMSAEDLQALLEK
ncbi:non-ribosomal peptide synthetase [Methylomicrobium agile]|uniref:non-ribosomal peptide synthetase n=1 Tax=Methylomicrobium agile TaxID=39774 RepID=UPI0012F6418D|nr:non-ribosomal peptide synthetase [Methylomicrobium agile]